MGTRKRYKVAQGTQVHYEGKTYDEGKPLPADVPDDQAEFWLNAGWIETA